MTELATQAVHWDLHYDIHLGQTWSRFMEGLKEKKILGTKCASCARVFVPAQKYCESCFERADEWVELPAEGTLETFTVAWLGFTGGPKPPYAIGAIRLDGASTLLAHWIVGPEFTDSATVGETLPIGSRVRAVWAPERTGQILDIAHFEPID